MNKTEVITVRNSLNKHRVKLISIYYCVYVYLFYYSSSN